MDLKNTFQLFKKSFKLDKRFLRVILLDALFYVIAIPVFMIYNIIINKQAQGLESIIGTTDVSSYLTTASAAELSFITADMHTFIFTFIIGAIVLFLVCLFSYSLSRILIWNYLLKKKFDIKKYLKFNLLNIILLIGAVIILLIALLISLISAVVFSIVLFLLMVGIIYFMFSLYIEYVKTGRLFYSFGNAFKRMDKNVYLLSLPVFIIIAIIIPLLTGLFAGTILNNIISVVLLFLFAAWMRIFVLESK